MLRCKLLHGLFFYTIQPLHPSSTLSLPPVVGLLNQEKKSASSRAFSSPVAHLWHQILLRLKSSRNPQIQTSNSFILIVVTWLTGCVYKAGPNTATRQNSFKNIYISGQINRLPVRQTNPERQGRQIINSCGWNMADSLVSPNGVRITRQCSKSFQAH